MFDYLNFEFQLTCSWNIWNTFWNSLNDICKLSPNLTKRMHNFWQNMCLSRIFGKFADLFSLKLLFALNVVVAVAVVVEPTKRMFHLCSDKSWVNYQHCVYALWCPIVRQPTGILRCPAISAHPVSLLVSLHVCQPVCLSASLSVCQAGW